MLDRKRKRSKTPDTTPLPAFTTCPMCGDVSPAKDVTTEVLLDGQKKTVCDSCAWTLGIDVGVGRLDE